MVLEIKNGANFENVSNVVNDFLDRFFWFDEQYNFKQLGKRTYYSRSTDNKEIMIINMAGFKKEDIDIKPKDIYGKNYLCISAKPNEDVKDIVDEIKDMRIEIKPGIEKFEKPVLKDGLLYITGIKEKNKYNIEW